MLQSKLIQKASVNGLREWVANRHYAFLLPVFFAGLTLLTLFLPWFTVQPRGQQFDGFSQGSYTHYRSNNYFDYLPRGIYYAALLVIISGFNLLGVLWRPVGYFSTAIGVPILLGILLDYGFGITNLNSYFKIGKDALPSLNQTQTPVQTWIVEDYGLVVFGIFLVLTLLIVIAVTIQETNKAKGLDNSF